MIVKAFGTAFGLSFIAELGDKTQLVILTLSARYSFLPVFTGAALAFVILNGLAVTVGAIAARFIPELVIRYASAAIFVAFGILSFCPEKEEDDEKKTARNPFLSALLAVSLMELGDKTQLSLVALTSKYESPFSVFLGGTLALWITSLIAALAGEALRSIIPLRWIRRASGGVFIAFGILIATGII